MIILCSFIAKTKKKSYIYSILLLHMTPNGQLDISKIDENIFRTIMEYGHKF